MKISNYYHAYLAALGIQYASIPPSIRTLPSEAHEAWAGISIERLHKLFRAHPLTPPLEPIRKLVWEASKHQAHPKSTYAEFFRVLREQGESRG